MKGPDRRLEITVPPVAPSPAMHAFATAPPSWFARAACWLVVGAALAGMRPAPAAESSPSTPATPIASIERWLVERGEPRGAAEWRRAAESAAADQLGGPLLGAASRAERRVEELAVVPIEGREASPPAWLGELPAPVGASLRLAIGERLYFDGRYDAALVWIDGIDAAQCYSPGLLAYLEVVCAHGVVNDKRARGSLAALAAAKPGLGPARRWVAEWVERELATDEPKPLALVERRMRDAHRRLAASEADETTVERQQQIVRDLDKLIKDLEEQQKRAQQAAQQAGAGGAQPSSPAEDSRPGELKGPGEVERKRIVAGGEWGSLPPAERERLAQGIARDFPGHYRRLVEEYFKALADPQAAALPAADRGPAAQKEPR